MSDIVKLVKAFHTGERRCVPTPTNRLLNEIASVNEKFIPNSIGKVYYIGLTLKSSAIIDELATQKAHQEEEAVSEAVRRTKNQIIEAVFGEFRQNFHLINMALSDRDYSRATKELDVMYHRMFTDET